MANGRLGKRVLSISLFHALKRIAASSVRSGALACDWGAGDGS